MTTTAPESPPASRSGRSALEVSIDAAHRAGEIIRDRFLTEKEVIVVSREENPLG